MDLNRFDNYDVHVLIPQNTENGELELKKIGMKFKDKIQFALHNNLINEK